MTLLQNLREQLLATKTVASTKIKSEIVIMNALAFLHGRLYRWRHNVFATASRPFEDTRGPQQAYLAFGLVILIHVLIQAAFEPQWLFGGSMWAEMATNYYPNSVDPSWMLRLFATDVGYIPLPQRLIALVPAILKMPAAAIPFVYSWVALLATAALVGSFCLPPFRKVAQSDALRAVCALAILFCSDFESRTFINFTYFGAFFIAIVTTLALVEPADDMPWWAWFIPLLFLSKPAVMSALPAMLITAIMSRGKFRWIAATSFLACIIQIVRLMVSQKQGIWAQTVQIPLHSKISAVAEYFPSLLTAYIFGPAGNALIPIFLVLGYAFLALVLVLVFCVPRLPALSLILCGLALLFSNLLLNCFTLSDMWGNDLRQVVGPPLYRHIIVGFDGCIMVMCGLVAAVENGLERRLWLMRSVRGVGVVLFATWFVCSGWLSDGSRMQHGFPTPIVGNSQWDIMAAGIDQGRLPLCIPIDPLNWTFGADCEPLQKVSYDLMYMDTSSDLETVAFDYHFPSGLADRTLFSLGLLVRPRNNQIVSATAIASLSDGRQVAAHGQRPILAEGGMVALAFKEGIKVADIRQLHLIVGNPVELAFARQAKADGPVVLLLGR